MPETYSIQKDIDDFLDSLALIRETRSQSNKADFRSQWYDYENEYNYNIY